MSNDVVVNAKKIGIPQNWRVAKLEKVAEKTKGVKPDNTFDEQREDLLPYLTTESLRKGPDEYAHPSDGEVCSETDTIIAWDGSAGKVLEAREGILGSTLASISFNKETVCPRYGYYYLKYFQPQIRSMAEGSTILHVPRDFMQVFDIIIPPYDYQKAIADRIDSVGKQSEFLHRTVEELDSLRSAALYQILRTGIGQGNKTKEVRIGPRSTDIPSNWSIVDIESLLADEKKAIRGGPAGSRIQKEFRTNEGYKMYFQDNVINDDFSLREDYLPKEKFDDLKSMEPIPGDVLVTLTGTNIGESAVFPEDAERGIYESNVMRIRLNKEKCVPEYLSILFNYSNIFDFQIESLGHGSTGTRKKLNNKIVKQIRVPLPPTKKQRMISDAILSIGEYSSAIQEERREMEHLKESLTGGLITGKVTL